MSKSFKDLEVWKKARLLRKDVSHLAHSFPSEEKIRLTDQMIRATRSVTANIAEGYGRFHYQENIQFCRLSRASLTEVQDHLTVALDENCINMEDFTSFDERAEECVGILNGYINFLIKSKRETP